MNSSPEPDVPLIRGLLHADAYPHPVSELRRLETHISWVILTGDIAYKVKKPVRYNFVDYSTLERRRICCEEELRLNRRLAADLYLEVVPISGPPEECRVQGTGDPCEYAVRMRQFSQADMLEAALDAGRLQLSHFDQFGRRLAEFHQKIAGTPPPEGLGTPQRIAQSVADVWELLREQADVASMPLVKELDDWRVAEEARLLENFAERRRAGFVRECHGDLHLGNLLLLGDEITAFDGIEFNPALRWIDVVSEAAFLTMDLEAVGRRDLAFTFLNAYLEATGDYAGLTLMPYYQVYRAAVRSAVTLLRGTQLAKADELQRIRATAERYLREADRSRHQAPPTLTITHGVSGSGKTSVTFSLLAREGSVRLRSDVERKRLFGIRPDERAAEEAYTPAATVQVYERLEQLAEQILRSGFSVIVDATFLRRDQRTTFAALADRRGTAFRILECAAPIEALRERVRQRAARGADASDATLDVLDAQLLADEPLTPQERDHAAPC